jgi:peptidyl-prolyl cis-trans isomerase D
MLSVMRKHAQSWIIKIALGLVSIVFIFWGVGSFRSDRASRVAKVNGETISVAEYQQAIQQTMDRIRSTLGQQFDEKSFYTPEFKKSVLNELIDKRLMLEEGRALGFSTTSEELSRTIQKMPFFQESGKFSLYKYKRILQMNRMTPEEFEAEQRSALIIDRVRTFVISSVKIVPDEVHNFYAYQNDEINEYLVRFKKEDYKKSITITPEQIKSFYNQHLSQYRTPVQVRVAYLDFSPKDFDSKVNIGDQEIQDYYLTNQQKFLDSKTKNPLPLDQVKDRIRALLKEEKVHELALQKTEEIYDEVLSKGNLKVFGSSAKVPVKETDWLTYGQSQSGIEGVPEFNQKAFALKKGELASILDLGPQWGFAILQVIDRKEAQTMDLAQAESKVKNDLLEEKAGQMALSEADRFLKELRRTKDIQKAAKERGKELEETGFFSRAKNSPSWAVTPEIQEILFSVGPSHPAAEKPFTLGEGYGIVFFKESRPAPLEDFKKDENRYYQTLLQRKQYELIGQWTRFLREKAKVSINQDLI